MRGSSTPGRLWTTAVAVAAASLGAACSGGGHHAATQRADAATTTPTTASTTTTTMPPTTTTRKPAPPLPGLGIGASGPAVLALQQRLATLHYDVTADGHFGQSTYYAVMAFQKVTGMGRTGRATDDVIARLASATDPAPMLPDGGALRVEIDIGRQVLFLYTGGSLNRILPVSTGSGARFCVPEYGYCERAVTPGGSFRVYRRVSGWDKSPLGQLLNPLYFNGGVAIHGAPSVPAYPASHGCVRIPVGSAGWFPGAVPNGTPVYVFGGPNRPAPFASDSPTKEPATTTTAAPPTTAPKPTTTTSPVPSTTSTTAKP